MSGFTALQATEHHTRNADYDRWQILHWTWYVHFPEDRGFLCLGYQRESCAFAPVQVVFLHAT